MTEPTAEQAAEPTTCPTCSSPVRVVGGVTRSFEPIAELDELLGGLQSADSLVSLIWSTPTWTCYWRVPEMTFMGDGATPLEAARACWERAK